MHGIISTVLQAVSLQLETLTETSCGKIRAYSGKLHSLLCMIYVANTESHLKLLYTIASINIGLSG